MANQPKKYKKFVATAATATLVASAIVPVASAADSKFSDMSSYDADTIALVEDLADKGIVSGNDGKFNPQGEVSRKHAVLMIGRFLKENGVKGSGEAKQFDDVSSADAEFAELALLVRDLGIFEGNDGKLNPSAKLSRENMALVMDRVYKQITGKSMVETAKDKGLTGEFTDAASIKEEARAAALAAKALGLSKADAFNPKGSAKRVHFAQFFYVALPTLEAALNGEKPEPGKTVEEAAKAVEEAVKALPAEVTKENAADAQKAVDAATKAIEELEKAAGEDASDEVKAAIKEAKEAVAKTQEAIDKATDEVVVDVKVESASAVNAKTVAVTFDKDVTKADLKAADFKVSNLAVTNVSVNGKVATLTLSSELSNGTTYTVDFEKEGSEKSTANFLYAVELEKGIKLTKTNFTIYKNQSSDNIFKYVTVADVNGKEIPESQIASKEIETDNTTVVTATAGSTKGDIIGQGTAKVNIKYTLTDGTVLQTGTIAITAAEQDATNSAGFSINTTATTFENTVAFKLAEAKNEHKTILYPKQGTAGSPLLSVFAFDANKDPLTTPVQTENSETVEYKVTAGDTNLQVNKNTGAIIYQAEVDGKATVNVKKGKFSYDAQVELRKSAELKDVTTTKSALQVAETNAVNTLDSGLDTDSLTLGFLDQYATKFGSGFNNKENGVADFTISTVADYTNDNADVIGKQAPITFTSHDGGARKGRVVVTADHTKLTVGLTTAGAVSVTSTNRDVTVDEKLNLTVTLYDENEATPKVLKTLTVPVTVKDITEPTAQKLFKSSDMDASGDAALSATSKSVNFADIELWEVDKDGDKIRKVVQGQPTVNRGRDLTAGATGDDVVISSNDVIEFEAVIANNPIAEAFIKEDSATLAGGATVASASLLDFVKDNKKTDNSSNAAVTAKYVFDTTAAADLIYGEDVTFTVKAKTGDATGTQLLTAQTVDVRAYNSAAVGKSATVKASNTIDISETNKVIGAAATAPIALKNALLGLYDVSEYIVDSSITLPGPTVVTNAVIALKNGQDGTVVAPSVQIKDQNGKELKLGPVSYGEAATNFAGGGATAPINDRLLSTLQGYSANQTVTFEATLLDFENVTGLGAIGAALTGSETVALDADKEQGTVKVLLTGVYRSGDYTNPLVKKNLLSASQIVTLTFTK